MPHDLRRSRPRRSALGCETLDGRQLLSTIPALGVKPVELSAAEIAQSNASEAPFAMSPGDTIRAGDPVAERLTTTYFDGSTQTESLVRVPDAANNSVISYETIDQRHGGGTETVIDTETFSGGTAPFSGPDVAHTITTTLPGGSVQTETETETETTEGHKTLVDATIQEAGGGVETVASVAVKHGRTTTTRKTITEPDGVVEHQTTVSTSVGDLDSTSRSTTTSPGEVQRSASATQVLREQPPAGS